MKKEKIDERLNLRISKSELKTIAASALINSPKPSGGGNVNKETRRLISNGHKYDALLAHNKFLYEQLNGKSEV